MLAMLSDTQRIESTIIIFPASEEFNRLQYYPNAILIDGDLINEDADLYEVLDGSTPTLMAGWEVIKAGRQLQSDAEEAEYAAGANDRAAAEVRTERDAKLTQSDWTQVVDAPVSQEDWAAYRALLRSMPEQEGFPNEVTWPTEPE
tara:strand:+ start:193 stop:630 length:438 start_codon:yes stop_codon:yes gene_type:complete